MNQLFRLLLLVLSITPNVAIAIDLDYYVYGGFDVTVNAFMRIALIFNDGQYIVMFFIAAVFGILFGGVISAGQKLLGGGGNDASIINFLILVLIGTALFKALIIPKGTVHIYDPVVNRYQAVGNVPDLIVLAAGITNKAERVLTEIVDNGSAHPRELQGQGIGLELMLNAFSGNVLGDEAYILKTMNAYVSDCLPIAETNANYNFDLKTLKSETTNIKNELAKLRNPSVFTVSYIRTKTGESVSCTEAWDSHLNVALNTANLYDEYVEQVCAKSGFAVSNPALRAAQMGRCKAIIDDAQDLLFDPLITSDYNKFMQDTMISKIIVSNLSDAPGTALRQLANQDIMTTGLASQMVSEDWLPAIKAVVFGVVLGMMPVLALFIVTPLVFKALHIMVGLLLWLALWGITDAIVHGIAMDQVISMSAGVIKKGMSLEALLMLPDHAAKGLAILGKAQSMGVLLATFIASVFFKISSYAFSQLGEKWQGDIERFGEKAGHDALNPVGRMEAMKRHLDAQAHMNTAGHLGIEGFAAANQQMIAAPYSQANSTYTGLRNAGMSHNQAIFTPGVHAGAESAGAMIAQQQYADAKYGGNLNDAALQQGANKAEIDISNVKGQHRAFQSMADKQGKSVIDTIDENAYVSQAKEVATHSNYAKDVQANNPDMDLTGAILKDTSAESLQSTSANRVSNERNEQKQKLAGTDRIGAAQKSALIDTAESHGKFIATKGDSTPYVEQAANVNEQGLAHNVSVARELAERGLTFANLGSMQGRQEGLSTVGENKGIDVAGEQAYIDGHHIDTAQRALRGETEIAKAEERNIPVIQQLSQKAVTDEAREQAETTTRQIQEKATGLSTDDLMTGRALAQNSGFTLSQKQTDPVLANLDLEDTATALALKNGGYADFKFAPDGSFVSARGYSGFSGESDNKYTMADGSTFDLTTHQESYGSISNVIENRHGKTNDEYKKMFSQMYHDPTTRDAVITQLAQERETTMGSSVTYQDMLGHSERIELSVGTPDLFKSISPVSGTATAAGYNEGTVSDQDTFNAHKLALDSIFERTLKESNDYMNVYSQKWPDTTSEQFQEVREAFASEKFAQYERDYTNTINEIAHNKLRGVSDQYDKHGKPDYSDVKIPEMKNIK